jgi:hypothetical protein
MLNGQGAGIYAWSGSKWMIVSSDGNGPAVPVTNLTINFPTAALRAGNSAVAGNSAESGDTIQFSVDVQPGNATNPNCKWSVVPGGGTSSITPEGLFTAGSPGDVTVRATATDGSGIYEETRVTVNPPTVPVTRVEVYYGIQHLSGTDTTRWDALVAPAAASNKNLIWSVESETQRGIVTVDRNGLIKATNVGSGTAVIRATSASNPSISHSRPIQIYAIAVSTPGPGTVVGANGTYKTYCYPGTVGCWMIENSKEGTPWSTTFPGKIEGERGYYYTSDLSAPCPAGWMIPTIGAFRVLAHHLTAGQSPAEETSELFPGQGAGFNKACMYGGVFPLSGWGSWAAYLALSTEAYATLWAGPDQAGERCALYAGSARCIKSK